MYDVIVIGAGWAGFTACMEAKSRGFKTALIERTFIGGTCLNTGCIPTKTLIQSAKLYAQSKKSASFGVTLQSPGVDFPQVQERKNKLIAQLRSGMELMLKGVDVISAEASIVAPDCVRAAGNDLKTKFILVATGSVPSQIKPIPFDGTTVLSSDHMLALSDIPGSLLIVGGGVIGCEFASLYAALGTKVTIVELLPQLLPGMDSDIAMKLATTFKKKGITVKTSCDVTTIDRAAFDKTLVCVGRKASVTGLGLDTANVILNQNGSCAVNDAMQTNIASIYAAGDCTGGLMLAHYAAYQGRRAIQAMAGDKPQPLAEVIPGCVFTDPEIASVGVTEERAKQRNITIKPYRFDFLGSGMARILDEADGYVKILCDDTSGKIIGGSIVGPKATELISTITVAIQAGMTAAQLRDTILPHPTLSEVITEALHKA